MAAKKKAPRNTRWRAVTWERTYRGVAVWIETMYARSPKWQWTVIDEWRTGRAVSRVAAMRAAMRAVDAMLDDEGGGRSAPDKEQWWDDRHSLLGGGR